MSASAVVFYILSFFILATGLLAVVSSLLPLLFFQVNAIYRFGVVVPDAIFVYLAYRTLTTADVTEMGDPGEVVWFQRFQHQHAIDAGVVTHGLVEYFSMAGVLGHILPPGETKLPDKAGWSAG